MCVQEREKAMVGIGDARVRILICTDAGPCGLSPAPWRWRYSCATRTTINTEHRFSMASNHATAVIKLNHETREFLDVVLPRSSTRIARSGHIKIWRFS